MTITIRDTGALLALGRALQRAGYAFTTVTPATCRRVNARAQNRRAGDLRGVFGWSRPFGERVVPAEMVDLMERAGILSPGPDAMKSLLRASTLNGRLHFHSAFPSDGEDAVFFGPDTVRFVAAIERALPSLARAPARIAEIGCGSGAAAIGLALRFPAAQVAAADINPSALALAGVNARLAGAGNVITAHTDLLRGLPGQFDLLVANPPYMADPQQRAYRHGGGMLGAELSIRLVEESLPRLAPGGTLLLYTGVAMAGPRDPFLDAVTPLLERHCRDWHYAELDPDVFGEQLNQPGYEEVERIAAVWLRAPVH